MESDPDLAFVANLGDAEPITHGGLFVYIPGGLACPFAIKLEAPPDHIDFASNDAVWTEYRFDISPCTWAGGILSDNSFHPTWPAWFAQPEGHNSLAAIAGTQGVAPDALAAMFVHLDVRARAQAWEAVGDHHGWENLDTNPRRYSWAEAPDPYGRLCERFWEEMTVDQRRRQDYKVFRRVWAHHPRGGRDYGYATDPYKGIYSLERRIAISVESAACGGGVSYPEVQVNLADDDDPQDPLNSL